MLSTLLVVGVISHLWCAARLVGIAHHSFYSVAEGAEGPSSGFEVIGRELAELDEGRSQEAMDNFFA